MATASKLITQNSPDDNGGSHQRNSSWVVCIISFERAAAVLSAEQAGPPKTKKILVIENDALGVTISNTKSSFGKLANLTVKSTNLWYPGYISPGDWMFVWMVDTQQKADEISKTLKDLPSKTTKLCDEFSGLKFAGRILNISTSDTVTNQSRTITQSITGQAFLEFATSVYYTYAGQAAAATLNPNQIGSAGLPTALSPAAAETFLKYGQDSVLGQIAEKFLEQYKDKNDKSPDTIIGLYYTFIMGVDSAKSIIDPKFYNKPATGHHIIRVPKQVAIILGKSSAEYLWQLIDVNLGMQKYNNTGTNWYQRFQPEFNSNFETNIKKTPIPTEGFVPFRPALWDNQSMWAIFGQFLNPVVNEMYTALRINKEGRIVPTFVVREKPFSTGMYNTIKTDGTLDSTLYKNAAPSLGVPESLISTSSLISSSFDMTSPTGTPLVGNGESSGGNSLVDEAAEQAAEANVAAAQAKVAMGNRTMFGTIPRWVISMTMIKSYSFSVSESNRINYVQVWGRNSSSEYLGLASSPVQHKQYQFDLGNVCRDDSDIARNGLRALIITSDFDISLDTNSVSYVNVWVRKNADWHFNGHLKTNATVTLNGVVDPICEGDNCLIGDLLYHIESVSHVGTINNGRKSFDTTLTLSNGVRVSSFNGKANLVGPGYAVEQSGVREGREGPGYTEIQELTSTTGDALKIVKGLL